MQGKRYVRRCNGIHAPEKLAQGLRCQPAVENHAGGQFRQWPIGLREASDHVHARLWHLRRDLPARLDKRGIALVETVRHVLFRHKAEVEGILACAEPDPRLDDLRKVKPIDHAAVDKADGNRGMALCKILGRSALRRDDVPEIR